MSGYVSSGGLVSSRVFTARILKTAISRLPSTQARVVRKLARVLSNRTGLGYYASLEIVANVGVRLLEAPSSQISTQISTKTTTTTI